MIRPKQLVSAAVLSLALAAAAACPVRAADPETLVFFGFHMTNTSLEPTTPEEEARVRMLDATFREMVSKSNKYKLVELPQAEIDSLAKGPGIGNCNGCEIDVGKRLGVTRVSWGEVQKVSNLILNLNIYVEDTVNNRTSFLKSTDIRNNTDDSWHRGMVFLLKNYMLAD